MDSSNTTGSRNQYILYIWSKVKVTVTLHIHGPLQYDISILPLEHFVKSWPVLTWTQRWTDKISEVKGHNDLIQLQASSYYKHTTANNEKINEGIIFMAKKIKAWDRSCGITTKSLHTNLITQPKIRFSTETFLESLVLMDVRVPASLCTSWDNLKDSLCRKTRIFCRWGRSDFQSAWSHVSLITEGLRARSNPALPDKLHPPRSYPDTLSHSCWGKLNEDRFTVAALHQVLDR